MLFVLVQMCKCKCSCGESIQSQAPPVIIVRRPAARNYGYRRPYKKRRRFFRRKKVYQEYYDKPIGPQNKAYEEYYNVPIGPNPMVGGWAGQMEHRASREINSDENFETPVRKKVKVDWDSQL